MTIIELLEGTLNGNITHADLNDAEGFLFEILKRNISRSIISIYTPIMNSSHCIPEGDVISSIRNLMERFPKYARDLKLNEINANFNNDKNMLPTYTLYLS